MKITGQVHKPNITVGERRSFALDSIVLCEINIDADCTFNDLERFDSFVFISKNGVIHKNTDLVFYNNLSDDKKIVTESLVESPTYDIQLRFKVSELNSIDEKIEVYLRFDFFKPTKTIFDYFKKTVSKKLNIQFILLDKKMIQFEKGETNLMPCNTLKLFELSKLNDETFQVQFTSETSDITIEEIIENKLKKADG
ncbi:hypothetical protein C3K47_07890 [Solitalea longa]|uniref:Uncharacterized protein n=1 Tax=Solitalea longa TaxID=2079460 RepID=A0A2S5A4D4_9SPHI|nr:hypothetical protein [Solitalea longa]POY36973.1 hypothetical protein C3K47_07890 [Solitalea longa]